MSRMIKYSAKFKRFWSKHSKKKRKKAISTLRGSAGKEGKIFEFFIFSSNAAVRSLE